MAHKLTKAEAKTLLENKLSHFFGVDTATATYEQYYRAVAMILNDIMAEKRAAFTARAQKEGSKRVNYLSMEFLMGRSLKNNLYNLNLQKTFTSVLKDLDIDIERLYEQEPDAGLGNGGLGRLAACYLDGMATEEIPARGYSILYEYGIFKQKIVDGIQTEMPDNWLPGGDVWLLPREESAVEVRFGGRLHESWDNQYHSVELTDYDPIQAVPYDMFVAGKDGDGVSVLRLWSAKAPGIDMKEFNEGKYLKAVERSAMAEVISKILYPDDNNPEGKALRVRQQYFLVSASVQDIVKGHLRRYSSLDNLPDKVAIQINDTHPAMVIPELMRIMLDECGYGWDDAWNIVTRVVSYTNHTVLKEALECWSVDLVKRLVPRIYQIIQEIDNRLRAFVWNATRDAAYVERTAIITGGIVKMANLCVASCHKVNGVSALHSNILKETVFNDFFRLTPSKFTNVTNGIAFRRWLCQANPDLTKLITDLIGTGFIKNNAELEKLAAHAGDAAVLERIAEVKRANKVRFAKTILRSQGIEIDPDSVFDVQVKRLHEYKRQLLNAFELLARYLEIKDNPGGSYVPRTYIFGAKAAPGYHVAKRIISFIYALMTMINSDPDVNKYMKVVFVEDYNVTKAEQLMPAADLSEQISLAGQEASGTGNMKLMLNGAVTIGTMDGANIEICEAVGRDNIIVFGMNTEEVDTLKRNGYDPSAYYRNNADLHRVIDFINNNDIGGQRFADIGGSIIHTDKFMVLADFADYRAARRRSEALYSDRAAWSKMSLINTAMAGRFSADRAVEDYARDIWEVRG